MAYKPTENITSTRLPGQAWSTELVSGPAGVEATRLERELQQVCLEIIRARVDPAHFDGQACSPKIEHAILVVALHQESAHRQSFSTSSECVRLSTLRVRVRVPEHTVASLQAVSEPRHSVWTRWQWSALGPLRELCAS